VVLTTVDSIRIHLGRLATTQRLRPLLSAAMITPPMTPPPWAPFDTTGILLQSAPTEPNHGLLKNIDAYILAMTLAPPDNYRPPAEGCHFNLSAFTHGQPRWVNGRAIVDITWLPAGVYELQAGIRATLHLAAGAASHYFVEPQRFYRIRNAKYSHNGDHLFTLDDRIYTQTMALQWPRSNGMLRNCLDLCAGIGGFRQGLNAAGFSVKKAVECDPVCARIYADNYKCALVSPDGKLMYIPDGHHDSYIYVATVQNTAWWHSASRVPHDATSAGPPCQPFAKSGHARGLNDERAFVSLEIAVNMFYFGPSYGLLESVSTFKQHEHAAIIMEVYAHAGFSRVFDQIAELATVAAVRRERWLCLLLADDLPTDADSVSMLHTKWPTHWPVINIHTAHALDYDLSQQSLDFTTWTDGERDKYFDPALMPHPNTSRVVSTSGKAFTFMASYGDAVNLPPALLESKGLMGFGVKCEDGVRYFSVNEVLALMCFHKYFVIGKYSKSSYKAIGNSISPLHGAWIAALAAAHHAQCSGIQPIDPNDVLIIVWQQRIVFPHNADAGVICYPSARRCEQVLEDRAALNRAQWAIPSIWAGLNRSDHNVFSELCESNNHQCAVHGCAVPVQPCTSLQVTSFFNVLDDNLPSPTTTVACSDDDAEVDSPTIPFQAIFNSTALNLEPACQCCCIPGFTVQAACMCCSTLLCQYCNNDGKCLDCQQVPKSDLIEVTIKSLATGDVLWNAKLYDLHSAVTLYKVTANILQTHINTIRLLDVRGSGTFMPWHTLLLDTGGKFVAMYELRGGGPTHDANKKRKESDHDGSKCPWESISEKPGIQHECGDEICALTERAPEVNISMITTGKHGYAFATMASAEILLQQKVESSFPLAIILSGWKMKHGMFAAIAIHAGRMHEVVLTLRDSLNGSISLRPVTILNFGTPTIGLRNQPMDVTLECSPMSDYIYQIMKMHANDEQWALLGTLPAFRAAVIDIIKKLVPNNLANAVIYSTRVSEDGNSVSMKVRVNDIYKEKLYLISGERAIMCKLKREANDPPEADIAVIPTFLDARELSTRAKGISGALGYFATHKGLVLRVKFSSLADARRKLDLEGTKYTDFNIGIRGDKVYTVQGFPKGTVAHAAIQNLHASGWATVPLRPFQQHGLTTWVVTADAEPANLIVNAAIGKLLITETTRSATMAIKPAFATSGNRASSQTARTNVKHTPAPQPKPPAMVQTPSTSLTSPSASTADAQATPAPQRSSLSSRSATSSQPTQPSTAASYASVTGAASETRLNVLQSRLAQLESKVGGIHTNLENVSKEQKSLDTKIQHLDTSQKTSTLQILEAINAAKTDIQTNCSTQILGALDAFKGQMKDDIKLDIAQLFRNRGPDSPRRSRSQTKK
jgi:site-specific DNA-cytosine methylase